MDPIILLVVIGVVIVIAAAVLVYIGVRNPGSYDDRELQARLDEFNQRGEQVDLEKIELSLPFAERVIYPIARKLGELAIRFTPQNQLQSVAKKLEMAGANPKLDPTMFMALQFIAAAVMGGIVLSALSLDKNGQFTMVHKVMFGLGGFVFGFFLPSLWVTSKIQKRQKEVRKAMPDALDLLTICVEAGLGFDSAMSKVSEKWESELSLAFARVIQEIQLGKMRREALRDMADRLGIPEMTSFVAAVIQSEQLGVSMAKVLRIQSDQMRMKRRQMAEEEAHKAPVKMLLPMALLIFPALMVTLMTPAALKLMNSGIGDAINGK